MSVSEENPQEIAEPLPIEEKVKRERSTLQKQVLEKARVQDFKIHLF